MKFNMMKFRDFFRKKFTRGKHKHGVKTDLSNVAESSNTTNLTMSTPVNETATDLADVAIPNDLSHSENSLIVENVNDDYVLLKTAEFINDKELIFGVSITGKSHRKEKTECQDYHKFTSLEDGWGVVLLSDGAGSALNAKRGSNAVCEIGSELVANLVQQYKDKSELPSDKEWYIEIRSVFEFIKEIFVKTAEQENIDYKTFAATALVLVYSPYGMLTAHIGDGRMGYKDSSDCWHALITPHKGEEACQTVFITEDWNVISNSKMSGTYIPETSVIKSIPKAFVLMTDGCEKATWECRILNNSTKKGEEINKPYKKFLDPMINMIMQKENIKEKFEEFANIIDVGNDVCKKETDDKTFVLGILL